LAVHSTQPSALSQCSNITDLTPATGREVVASLNPILNLVAPTGMSEDDRTAWFASAGMALAGIPLDLLKRGVAKALIEADHPAKIVRTIMLDVREDWEWRKRHAKPVEIHGTDAAPQLTDDSRYTLDEVRKLPKAVRGLGVAGGWIDPSDLAIVEAEERLASA
jgi:hypothetical protein